MSWKQIAEWSAEGFVRGAVGAVGIAVFALVWAMIDMETMMGLATLAVVGVVFYFIPKLIMIPDSRVVTQAEYEALKTLGKLRKNTHYNILEKENP